MSFSRFGLSVLLLFASNAHAQIQTQEFPTQNGTCGLKRASFGQITFDSPKAKKEGLYHADRIEMIGAFVETSDPTCLRNYAYVQWIRGCAYTQDYDRTTKKLSSYLNIIRDSRAKTIKFVHKDWEVDSLVLDPLYFSASASHTTDPKRLNYYYVPKQTIDFTKPALAQKQVERFVNYSNSYTLAQDMKIPFSVYAVKDAPVFGSWSENRYDANMETSTVTALDFKMCLYRTQDIPITGDPARFDRPLNEGGPVHCFDWSAKNRWNYETQKIERFTEDDPFCASPQ